MEDTDEDMPWDFNPFLRRLTAQTDWHHQHVAAATSQQAPGHTYGSTSHSTAVHPPSLPQRSTETGYDGQSPAFHSRMGSRPLLQPALPLSLVPTPFAQRTAQQAPRPPASQTLPYKHLTQAPRFSQPPHQQLMQHPVGQPSQPQNAGQAHMPSVREGASAGAAGSVLASGQMSAATAAPYIAICSICPPCITHGPTVSAAGSGLAPGQLEAALAATLAMASAGQAGPLISAPVNSEQATAAQVPVAAVCEMPLERYIDLHAALQRGTGCVQSFSAVEAVMFRVAGLKQVAALNGLATGSKGKQVVLDRMKGMQLTASVIADTQQVQDSVASQAAGGLPVSATDLVSLGWVAPGMAAAAQAALQRAHVLNHTMQAREQSALLAANLQAEGPVTDQGHNAASGQHVSVQPLRGGKELPERHAQLTCFGAHGHDGSQLQPAIHAETAPQAAARPLRGVLRHAQYEAAPHAADPQQAAGPFPYALCSPAVGSIQASQAAPGTQLWMVQAEEAQQEAQQGGLPPAVPQPQTAAQPVSGTALHDVSVRCVAPDSRQARPSERMTACASAVAQSAPAKAGAIKADGTQPDQQQHHQHTAASAPAPVLLETRPEVAGEEYAAAQPSLWRTKRKAVSQQPPSTDAPAPAAVCKPAASKAEGIATSQDGLPAPAESMPAESDAAKASEDSGRVGDATHKDAPAWLQDQVTMLLKRSIGASPCSTASLVGRSVAFLLLSAFDADEADSVPAGLHCGRVLEPIAEEHPEDVCVLGCEQEHAFHYVRLLSGSQGTAQAVHIDLKLDLHKSLRQGTPESLLPLSPDALQDAWILLAPKEALDPASDSKGPSAAAAMAAEAASPGQHAVKRGRRGRERGAPRGRPRRHIGRPNVTPKRYC